LKNLKSLVEVEAGLKAKAKKEIIIKILKKKKKIKKKIKKEKKEKKVIGKEKRKENIGIRIIIIDIEVGLIVKGRRVKDQEVEINIIKEKMRKKRNCENVSWFVWFGNLI